MTRSHPWVLLGCLVLLSACSKPEPTPHDYLTELPKAISESIDEVLTDPERAQTAKNSAIRFEYAVRSYNEEAWKIRTRAFLLNANYGTNREKFDTFLLELRDLRASKQDQIIHQALLARETMTEEEWGAFHDALDERLETTTGEE